MEHDKETDRLERKTDPESIREQARWCGIKPGQRLLDLGCGPGKTTAILRDMVQPGGTVLGLDASEDRIAHARRHYGNREGIQFAVHDLRKPLDRFGLFDAVWVRFVLEYFHRENREVVQRIYESLRPGGFLYLIDLDHNFLSHYEMPPAMAALLPIISRRLEEHYNFDAYAGRKLYSHLYDLGFEEIDVQVTANHTVFGEIGDIDSYNWTSKLEVMVPLVGDLLESYPGGSQGFVDDCRRFFHDPRRFSYNPLIMCKGRKPTGPTPDAE